MSAIAFVAVVLAGSPILLPFLLALVVAYVLFPAVRFVERARIPRWVAILLVYAVTIGGITGFGWATIPRFLSETKQLSTELPKLIAHVRDEWLPALDAKLAQWSGLHPDDMGKPATSDAPAEPPPAPEGPSSAPPPNGGNGEPPAKAGTSASAEAAEAAGSEAPAPIVVVPRPQGGFEIRVRDDLELRQTNEGAWSLRPAHSRTQQFSAARALREVFDQASGYAQSNAGQLLGLLRRVVAGLSRGIFYLFITLMLAGYLMHTYERIHGFVRELWPEHRRAAFDRYLRRLDVRIAGVVRGQLIICLVNGVLTAIGLWLFGVKYWPVLSLIAAVMSLIPIFGSILSSIPAVAIALTLGFGTALAVLAWIVGIHQLEANLLNPKIIGDAAKIHPVLVVFSLLIGEHFFGIPGALLAVPCLAVVQATFMHFRESVLGLSSGLDDAAPAAAGGGPAPLPEETKLGAQEQAAGRDAAGEDEPAEPSSDERAPREP